MPVRLPASTHRLGTALLLTQTWNTATPRTLVRWGSTVVDPTSLDLTLAGMQAQSGTVVISAGLPSFRHPFTDASTVTVPGATHGLSTAHLFVVCRDSTGGSSRLDL